MLDNDASCSLQELLQHQSEWLLISIYSLILWLLLPSLAAWSRIHANHIDFFWHTLDLVVLLDLRCIRLSLIKFVLLVYSFTYPAVVRRYPSLLSMPNVLTISFPRILKHARANFISYTIAIIAVITTNTTMAPRNPLITALVLLCGGLFVGGPSPQLEPAPILTLTYPESHAVPTTIGLAVPVLAADNASLCQASDYLAADQNTMPLEQCSHHEGSEIIILALNHPPLLPPQTPAAASASAATVIFLILACCAQGVLTLVKSSARARKLFACLLPAERRTRLAFITAYIAFGAAVEASAWVRMVPHFQPRLEFWRTCIAGGISICWILYKCLYLGTDDAIDTLIVENIALEQQIRDERSKHAWSLGYVALLGKLTYSVTGLSLGLVVSVASQNQSLRDAEVRHEKAQSELGDALARNSELDVQVASQTQSLRDAEVRHERTQSQLGDALARNSELDIQIASQNRSLKAARTRDEATRRELRNAYARIADLRSREGKQVDAGPQNTQNGLREAERKSAVLQDQNDALATKIADLESQLESLRHAEIAATCPRKDVEHSKSPQNPQKMVEQNGSMGKHDEVHQAQLSPQDSISQGYGGIRPLLQVTQCADKQPEPSVPATSSSLISPNRKLPASQGAKQRNVDTESEQVKKSKKLDSSDKPLPPSAVAEPTLAQLYTPAEAEPQHSHAQSLHTKPPRNPASAPEQDGAQGPLSQLPEFVAPRQPPAVSNMAPASTPPAGKSSVSTEHHSESDGINASIAIIDTTIAVESIGDQKVDEELAEALSALSIAWPQAERKDAHIPKQNLATTEAAIENFQGAQDGMDIDETEEQVNSNSVITNAAVEIVAVDVPPINSSHLSHSTDEMRLDLPATSAGAAINIEKPSTGEEMEGVQDASVMPLAEPHNAGSLSEILENAGIVGPLAKLLLANETISCSTGSNVHDPRAGPDVEMAGAEDLDGLSPDTSIALCQAGASQKNPGIDNWESSVSNLFSLPMPKPADLDTACRLTNKPVMGEPGWTRFGQQAQSPAQSVEDFVSNLDPLLRGPTTNTEQKLYVDEHMPDVEEHSPKNTGNGFVRQEEVPTQSQREIASQSQKSSPKTLYPSSDRTPFGFGFGLQQGACQSATQPEVTPFSGFKVGHVNDIDFSFRPPARNVNRKIPMGLKSVKVPSVGPSSQRQDANLGTHGSKRPGANQPAKTGLSITNPNLDGRFFYLIPSTNTDEAEPKVCYYKHHDLFNNVKFPCSRTGSAGTRKCCGDPTVYQDDGSISPFCDQSRFREIKMLAVLANLCAACYLEENPPTACHYSPHHGDGTKFRCSRTDLPDDDKERCCGDPSQYDGKGRLLLPDGEFQENHEEAVESKFCWACYQRQVSLSAAAISNDDDKCYYREHGADGEKFVCCRGDACWGDPSEYDHSGQVPWVPSGWSEDAEVEARAKRLCARCYLNSLCYYKPHLDEEMFKCVRVDKFGDEGCCGDPFKYDEEGNMTEYPPAWTEEDAKQAEIRKICAECYVQEVTKETITIASDCNVCYYQEHQDGEVFPCYRTHKMDNMRCRGDPSNYNETGVFTMAGKRMGWSDEADGLARQEQLCFDCYLRDFCYYQPHSDNKLFKCSRSEKGGSEECCGESWRYDIEGSLEWPLPGSPEDACGKAFEKGLCVQCHLQELAHKR